MAEWIMKEEMDMDGVDCYIRKGELIRCKDCKYYEHGENPSETWSTCTAHINRYIETCADNFCSWAERKQK